MVKYQSDVNVNTFKTWIFTILVRLLNDGRISAAGKQMQIKATSKTTISSTLLIRKCYKGTVVNRALPTLLGGSLELTLTVPLTLILQCTKCFK